MNLSFLKEYKTLILIFICLFVVYWLIFVLTPKTTITIEYEKRIDSLNILIVNVQKSQQILNNKIDSINMDISKVDDDINKIRKQKTIIKEIYHEKINDIIYFTEPEIDSFFTNRFK
jgi:vacuolar-type H+-ATPase subunit I/STV1